MSLNLISDAWIPVLDQHGARRLIAPWQMADARLSFPDWPRADLNIACLELLIGLVFMADPPADLGDWITRQPPDPDRLRERLAPFAPAFNLLGDGPLFLQDLEKLEGEPNPPDMLFIDSAGANAAKNNADLMVHRARYPSLDLPLAAMALFAFQAHAPAGGAGNRTSMRGGGPLVTLVDPGQGLWSLIWANVPEGTPGKPADLPWTRATRVSDKGAETLPPTKAPSVEAFFGMPRRLRLIGEAAVNGVVQKPWGTNYAFWTHPLTPYYRQKPGTELLPVHPRAGIFGYRHWLGILAEVGQDGLRDLATCLRDWDSRSKETGAAAKVILAGWAMDNMKPRDFTWSVQPMVDLSPEGTDSLRGMIQAAEQAALALRSALEPVLAGGEAREAEREAFYQATEAAFLSHFAALKGGAAVAEAWLADLSAQAMRQFDALALPGLDQRETDRIEAIVKARGYLGAAFKGYGAYGDKIFTALELTKPEKPKKGKAA
ncbi:type I-E CRISPR-associated protein Cse1/CasA [Rhodobacter sp. KR11]|uniref:type I-E CRISPR-associated protein Cse1/CasA n=1 Tax=Rhodobacter sp. KR11 TaxID=2974588 RepID=UPI0022239238|nr:type I-E CRISPR-associated protein Cse1/CasA [Rhodobacter sp. KR11]MCW1918121.1 type I-E CRISPR-associated protein Cse1/CasA [Rhodobacter sp. KR11]